MTPLMRIPAAFLALLGLVSALQVTPNSPCASVCIDQPNFDVSAPASSNTRNTDIVCTDAALSSTPQGQKWKDCMTCLQHSTFSQGPENDQMWFLYNARYSLAYCVFAYPNASDAGSTPCSTTMACGPLGPRFKNGILDPRGITTFSYCSADGGDGRDTISYDRCVSCVSAEGTTEYLANSVVALEAGCLQQPATGQVLGLNDTIFAPTAVTIVDPLTLIKAPDQGNGLPGTTIAGIVGGALGFLLILSAFLFICYRKRKNRRARAEFEKGRSDRLRHRHQSSISFQCQTHAMSPRFWPGGGEQQQARSVHDGQHMGGDVYAQSNMPTQQQHSTAAAAPGDLSRRSSLWKPHNSMSSYENSLDGEKGWDSPYQDSNTAVAQFTQTNKPGSQTNVLPLHHIKTNIPPTVPRNARTSPGSAVAYNSPADIATPMSAESTRSTTALLPGIKPYIPAEHGVHGSHHGSPTPPSLISFSSPVSGSAASPLMRNGWPEPRQPGRPRSTLSSASNQGIGIAISSVPPPPVPWIKTPLRKKSGGGGDKRGVTETVTALGEGWEEMQVGGGGGEGYVPPPPPPPKR
ncbi:hypothetical protein QBC47DRAFT_10891 [Echria macrotheca]|uniref:LPXTG-domain-containing protein n=1 Tax=Echria macrotheca TaxID=438768 RepID=A0AAJ0FB04_9PEZI|nr:hypothetical protein QBC47DRAFT_10891 [Echria macrotheca]